MADKTLEQRQTEMRQRLSQKKSSAQAPAIVVQEKSSPEESDTPTQTRLKGPTITSEGSGIKTISRSDLYQLVWSEPVMKVSKRFGVSDVAVAKACRRHDIPLPGRGYWARVAAGQPVSKDSLPRVEETDIIAFCPSPESAIKRSEILDIQHERLSENKISVSDEPSDLHPLVRRSLVILSRTKPNVLGLLEPPQDCVGLYVSPGQLTRGIAIMDAVLKTLVAREYAVETLDEALARTNYYWLDRFKKWRPFLRTKVVVADEELAFALCESTKRVPHVPTLIEKRQLAKGDRYGIPEHDEIPSGELTLWIDLPDGLRVQAQWSDGKSQRLENCLNRFVAGLVAASHAIKKQREEEERRQRERQEQERRNAELARCRAEENHRIEKLDQQMSNWKRASDIRAYAAAIAEFATRQYGNLDPESELGKWVSWIKRYADKVDPLIVSQEGDDST